MNKEQGPIELTTPGINPTLETRGDIFMPDGPTNGPEEELQQPVEKSKPKTPEDTVAHLTKINAERMGPVVTSGSPLDWDTLPLDLRRGLKDLQRDRAIEQLLEQQFIQRQDPHAISPAQQEALDNVYKILKDDPKSFADAYVRVIDTLSQKRAEPIVHGDAINLVKQALEQAQISEKSKARLLKRAQKALEKTPPEFARSFRRIINEAIKEEGRLKASEAPREASVETQAQQEQAVTEAEEIIESAEDNYSAIEKIIESAPLEQAIEAIQEKGEGYIVSSTSDLPKNSSEKYLDSFNELKKQKDLSPEELRKRFQDILKNIRDERKSAGLDDPLSEEAAKHTQGLTDEEKQDLEGLQKESVETEQSEPGGGGDGDGRPPSRPTAEGSPESEEPGESESESGLQGAIYEIGGYIEGLSKNPDFIYNLAHNANVYGLISDAFGFDSEEKKVWDEIIDDFDSSSEDKIQQTQAKLNRFFANIVNTIKHKDREGLSHRITSVQDLSKWIIKNQDSELWDDDGVYPLLDKDGNFNQANFMIWLREESVKHHKNNPNLEMTPLSSVGISTDYRDISVYAMSLLKEQYMRDTKEGQVLGDLAEQLIYEGFMFGELRNMHLFYTQEMGDDKKMDQLLQKIHAKNTLTRPGNLKMLMTMSEDWSEDKSIRDRDTRVGDTFRIAIDMYNNISDPETLIEILGDKQITQEDFKDVFRILNKLKDWDEEVGDFGEFHFGTRDDGSSRLYYFDISKNSEIDLFNKDGSVDMYAFSKVMNFYDAPSEESTKLDVIREIVRLKAAQKSELKRTGIAFSEEDKKAKRENFENQVRDLIQSGKTPEQAEKIAMKRLLLERYAHRASLEFAEVMAFSWQRPYGSAAKQDLGRAGYDAMTKMSTEEYLVKQSDINRGGAVGIPDQLGLFRDLSPDPMTGIRTESGRTINAIMRDLRNFDNGKEVLGREGKSVTKQELVDELKFREYSESYYSRNQQMRAVQIFHTLSDASELDLDKIVSWTYLEGVKYNVGEFQKQINEGIIKPFRYSIINSNVNYAEQVRIYDVEKSERQKVNVYRTGSLAEKTVGKELYAKLVRDFDLQTDDKGNLLNKKYSSFDEFLGSYDARVRLAKNSSLGVFAAQLRSHRRLASLGQSWDYHRTETFIDALKTIQAYEEDPNNPGRYIPARDKNGRIKRYYSDKDIEWLRKNSGTEVWRMVLRDSARKGGEGAVSGLFEGLKKFYQGMLK